MRLLKCSGGRGHRFTKSRRPTGTLRNGPRGGEGHVKGRLFSAWPKATQQRPQSGSFYSLRPRSRFKPRCLVMRRNNRKMAFLKLPIGNTPSTVLSQSTSLKIATTLGRLLFSGLRCRSASVLHCTTLVLRKPKKIFQASPGF